MAVVAFPRNASPAFGTLDGAGYGNPIWGQGARLARYRIAAGLFDYHQLMMPFDDPTRIGDEVKWALTLYIIVSHGTLGQDAQPGAANAGGVAIR